jgi:hypothetical protein
VPDTESQPLQPLNVESSAGVAVRTTTVPLLISAEQTVPQLIPAGLDVMVPSPTSSLVFVTVSVKRTVKLGTLVAVPPGAVTLSRPVDAPAGTVARMAVADVTVNAAGVPLNMTAVAPVKFIPLIVMLSPTVPLVGVKPVIVGATVKALALVAVPPGVVTLRGPVVAPDGTVA